MIKAFLSLIALLFAQNISAFELPKITASQLPAEAAFQVPPPQRIAPETSVRAAASYAVYKVNGVDVVVPSISCGREVLAVLPAGASAETMAAKLRSAFNSPASARPVPITPKAKAETELAAQNPGAAVVSLNQFFPPAVAQLFNDEPYFAGPNCFNAAFMAAGVMPQKIHVGNSEAAQLFSMYFKSVPAANVQAGDIVVFNNGDHAVYYLGGGLVFHKKSYLKQHIYRIALMEKAYEPEPYEWTPSIFDGGSQFSHPETIRSREAWHPTGAQYQFGQATPDETAKVNAVIFINEAMLDKASRWDMAEKMGYFTERLLERLVSDWSAMGKSRNPVIRAYYSKLESLRDQANQSIELELLSSPHAQANADEILRGVWLPRNEYSRGLVGQLLKIYGKDPSLTEKVLDGIAADYDRDPLAHVKSGN